MADELRCSLQYIYYRGSVLRRRLGLPAGRERRPFEQRRRANSGDAVQKFGRAVKLDAELVKELFNDGAAEWEIARLFGTSEPAVRAALKS